MMVNIFTCPVCDTAQDEDTEATRLWGATTCHFCAWDATWTDAEVERHREWHAEQAATDWWS